MKLDGHVARKRFGQNFLHDARVIAQIVQAIDPQPGDQLIEIGPGMGALTIPLLAAGQPLTVVEMDRDLIAALPRRTAGVRHDESQLTIIEADALRFDFSKLIGETQRLKIVGNLPYNISTPLLFHLLQWGAHIEQMVFMLQKEVVERIVASPGSKTYGRLSVMMQYYCEPEFLFSVPPGAFNPPPQVTSAVFRLKPYQIKPIQAQDEKRFAQLVTTLFNHRRKTLRSVLKHDIAETTWENLGIDPQARPETLSRAQFVALADSLENQATR